MSHWIPGHTELSDSQLSRDLERELELPAGWIERRTGVRRRTLAAPHQATSDLAIEAGRRALQAWNGPSSEIALLILATSTPDHLLPPTAPAVASALGLGCGALDVAAACTGFLSSLILARDHARAARRNVLVVAANVLSRRLRQDDAATRSLFADGAAALIVTPDSQILGHRWGNKGDARDLLLIPDGGSRQPFDGSSYSSDAHCMQMIDGPGLFRHAVRQLTRCSQQVLDDVGISSADLDWWIPHPGNQRLLEEVRHRLGIAPEKTLSTLREHGNSSAATIPLALSLAHQRGLLRPGQRLLLGAVGAGLVECAAVIEW